MKNSIQYLKIFFLASISGCQYERLELPSICDEVTIDLELLGEVINAECGVANGQFEVLASGGEGEFVYSIGSGEQASGAFSNLKAGSYSIVATDANGCFGSIQIDVQNRNGINISLTATESGCESTNATITVNAEGGETPYQFRLYQGQFGSSNQFSSLAAGNYEVTAKDNLGCEITKEITVLTGIEYSATIENIIQSNCAIASCHGGSQSPDLRSFQNIQSNASRIKTRTSARTMPPSSSLTQSQIDAIACWVDDGAPNN